MRPDPQYNKVLLSPLHLTPNEMYNRPRTQTLPQSTLYMDVRVHHSREYIRFLLPPSTIRVRGAAPPTYGRAHTPNRQPRPRRGQRGQAIDRGTTLHALPRGDDGELVALTIDAQFPKGLERVIFGRYEALGETGAAGAELARGIVEDRRELGRRPVQ